jgi:hypothetical protein
MSFHAYVQTRYADPNSLENNACGNIAPPPIEFPSTYGLIWTTVNSLLTMFLVCSSLVAICVFFVLRRELMELDRVIMLTFPVLLMSMHVYMLVVSLSRTFLYYSVLSSGNHLVWASNCMSESDRKKEEAFMEVYSEKSDRKVNKRRPLIWRCTIRRNF